MSQPAGTSTLVQWSERHGAPVNLVCIGTAGAGAGPFRSWAAHLPEDISLYAVRLPGRESRLSHPMLTDMAAVVDALAADLAELDGSVALFGHCSGALIAFSLAHRLQRSVGSEFAHLFVAGHAAPRLLAPPPETSSLALSNAELVERLRELGGTPPAILENPRLMTIVAPMLRADMAVMESFLYAEGDLLTCPISAFVGSRDEHVRPEDARSWEHETSGRFTLTTLTADHFLREAWDTVPRLIGDMLAPHSVESKPSEETRGQQ